MAIDMEMAKAIIGLALTDEQGDVVAKGTWADQVLADPDGFYEVTIMVVRTLAHKAAGALGTTREEVLRSLLLEIAAGEAGSPGGESG